MLQIPKPLTSTGFVLTQSYDKRDGFDFDIVQFPFLDGDVRHQTSYGVCISHLINGFAKVCSHVNDFNVRNKGFNAKLLKQSFLYHKLQKAFSILLLSHCIGFLNQCRIKKLFSIKAYRLICSEKLYDI